MILSEFIRHMNGNLLRDGQFDAFDYCTTPMTHNFLGFLDNKKYIKDISPYMSCVICRAEFVEELPSFIKGIYVSEKPKLVWQILYNAYASRVKAGRQNTKTTIGMGTTIHPFAQIAEYNVSIGNDVIIEEFAVVKENVRIGDHCRIRTGAILGGKGFAHTRDATSAVVGMEDMGLTILESGVEIYPYVHVANATLPHECTQIGTDAKIDAFTHVGHGAQIGKRVFIAAGTKIGGNCVIGDEVWIGINATISNRIRIGDRARISLGSVVTKNVEDGKTVSGNFAIDHTRFLENIKKSIS